MAERWRVEEWVLPLLFAGHVCLSVFLAWNFSIWIDECFTLNTTGRDLAYALHQSLYFELQPPLYFLLLTLWRQLDDGYFFGRLFSLLWSVGTLVVCVGVSRRWLPKLHPGWFCACLALNPFLVWASNELRLYSFAAFLSSLLLLLLYDGFVRADASVRSRWLYGLVSVAALYTQYYLGFLLVAGAAGLLVARRWRPLVQYVGAMLGVGVAFAPMIMLVLSQVTEHTGTLVNDATPIYSVLHISYIAQEMVYPIYGLRSLSWLAVVAPMAAAAGLVLWFSRQRLGERERVLWTSLVVSVLVYISAIFISGPNLVTIRHCAGLFVMLNLVPLSILALLEPRPRRWALTLWLLIVLSATGYELIRLNGQLAKSGDWYRVAQFIQEREAEGQPILVFPAEEALPFSMHYRGVNAIIPIPRPADFKTLHGSVLHSPDDVAKAVATVPGEHEALWVLSTMRPGNDTFISVPYNSHHLLDYLSKNYRGVTGQDFLGSELLFVKRK